MLHEHTTKTKTDLHNFIPNRLQLYLLVLRITWPRNLTNTIVSVLVASAASSAPLNPATAIEEDPAERDQRLEQYHRIIASNEQFPDPQNKCYTKFSLYCQNVSHYLSPYKLHIDFIG